MEKLLPAKLSEDIDRIHGGGATDRKRKLLDKQKKGKQRLRTYGKVDIPQEAFIAALKVE